jgi:predicted TIM-barrel fold metal-dependent hydrolase
MERLTVVSVDSHAQMPPELWPQYLDRRYHDLLPGLHQEQADYWSVIGLGFSATHDHQLDVFDSAGAYAAGQWRGLWDLDVRLQEMDREGIAAEFVNNGDGRAVALFFESGNKVHSLDACRAGVQAYHRWVHDTFGSRPDRLFLVGAVGTGPGDDLDASLAELDWIADRGFRATTVPGFTAYPGDPSLLDGRWEPFWARCAERGLALMVHAGWGLPQGSLADGIAQAARQYEKCDGDLERFFETAFETLGAGIFDAPFPRQAMWQLMFSGVFDRHPELVLVMNEVRGDWVPAALAHLDEVWAAHRDELPAKRPPSEYWASNCHVCLSFVHKEEVARRHDLGIERISFGRDYPHTEGTWPNTGDWLRDAFAGVPEDELRLMLGGNAIATFGLDRTALDALAARIGPSVDDVLGGGPVDPGLVAHFDLRGGYLKPYEGDSRVAEIAPMVEADLARMGIAP